MISDLGRAVCRDWHGHWVCSPRAFLFNAAVGAAGLLLLLAVVIAHRRLPKLWGAALGCLALGLLWLAVFPADGSPVHMVGGVLALPVTSVLLMLHRCPGDHRKVPPVASWSVTVVGALSATVSLDHLAPAPAPVARGVAEGISIAGLALVLLVTATVLLTAGRRRAPGALF